MDEQYRLPKTLPSTIAVVGSRNFPRLDKVVDLVRALPFQTVLISGGAKGVDATAEMAALSSGYSPSQIIIFPVTKEEWESLGKRAGPIRNERLLRFVKKRNGFVFIFASTDNGKITPGSNNVLTLCKKMNIPYLMFTEDIPLNNDFNKDLTPSHEQTKKTPDVGDELDKEIRKGKPIKHRVKAGDVHMQPVRQNIELRSNEDRDSEEEEEYVSSS